MESKAYKEIIGFDRELNTPRRTAPREFIVVGEFMGAKTEFDQCIRELSNTTNNIVISLSLLPVQAQLLCALQPDVYCPSHFTRS